MAELPEALRRLAAEEPQRTVAVVVVLADEASPPPEASGASPELVPVAGLKGILCGRLQAGRLSVLARSPAIASIEPDTSVRALDKGDLR